MRFIAVLALLALLPTCAEAHLGGGGRYAKRVALEAFKPECEGLYIKHASLPRPTLGRVYRDRCLVLLSRRLHNEPWLERCSLLVHEFGHLAGLEHVSDPRNIMHPRRGTWPACRK